MTGPGPFGMRGESSGFTLPDHTVAVWQFIGTTGSPEVGSIGPTVGPPRQQVTIAGKGFGTSTGQVLFGSSPAFIQSWSDTAVVFQVPSVANGIYQVHVKNTSGTAANTIQFTVLTAPLVPVTLTAANAIPTNPGDYIFLTGSAIELGSWGTTFDTAIGPMLAPNYPNWFLNVSVPAGSEIQFKFIKIAANGAVTWENGGNHEYTAPATGTGNVNVNWRN